MRCAAAPGCGETTGPREMARNEIVDVLIIGSGASGAAVAWSLAETKMHILCLEQGDWMSNADFPSHGRDWEARRYSDFDISPLGYPFNRSWGFASKGGSAEVAPSWADVRVVSVVWEERSFGSCS
jgi:cation diffusion facilitator CzcD-associated flavoprotein CzcO